MKLSEDIIGQTSQERIIFGILPVPGMGLWGAVEVQF